MPADRLRERPLSVTFTAEGYTPPTLADFNPPAILFGGTPFEIDRLVLLRLVM